MITHVAIIMDGNRRWAKARGLPTFMGHAKGYKNIEKIVQHAKAQGIAYITLWAFSTENWNREQKEIDYLLSLFRKLFKSTLVKRILQQGGKIEFLGNLDRFPEDIREECKRVVALSKNNTGITINIAFNYGGRSEILQAIQKIIKQKISADKINEAVFSSYLYTANQPEPDLIIRTGGEQRLSGYLPWQSIYSELYFTETYWPDFGIHAFDQAIDEFKRRERRFGK